MRHGAYDAQSALDIIVQGFQPKLTFLDLTLPGLDGFEVAKALRDRDPTMTMFVLTG